MLLGIRDKLFTRLGSETQVSHLPVSSQTPGLNVLFCGAGHGDLVSVVAGTASTGRVKQNSAENPVAC